MALRALQIVDAAVALFSANAALASAAYKNRAETLSLDEQELPAVAVMLGDDDSLGETGAVNLTYLDSLLTLNCTAVCTAATESQLIDLLSEMRRQIHVSLMADRSLGLNFVIDTRYQGSIAPEITTSGELMVGRLTTRWAVHYRMNSTDSS